MTTIKTGLATISHVCLSTSEEGCHNGAGSGVFMPDGLPRQRSHLHTARSGLSSATSA